MNTQAPAVLTDRQIQLVKQTVAADCNDVEFNLFMEAVRGYRLDPFRRQIMAIVFNKDNKKKRRMSIIIGIDGQRIMARRCGDYRPADKPPQYEYDEELKSDLNPHGIVSCTTYLYQSDEAGNWYPVVGTAYWDEFAPIVEEWGENESGQWRPTGKQKLADGNWKKMGRLMIAKCATMQALRAGWPDEYGGAYSEEEMHQAMAQDLSASERVKAAEQEDRQKKLGHSKNDLIVSWMPEMPLEPVSIGSFADRVIEWVNDASHSAEQIVNFLDRNRIALREFWAAAPGDALEMKRAVEQAIEKAQTSTAQAEGVEVEKDSVE